MLLLEFVFVIYVTVIEAKERNAGLLVLPPLVIGYDELNSEESTENNKKLDDLYRVTPMERHEIREIRRRYHEMETKNESRNRETNTRSEEIPSRYH